MTARSAWQAITLPPHRFLTSAWPWRCLAYLATGAALGAVTVLALAALLLTGALLAVLVVGLAMLGASLLSGVVVARFERRRLRLVDDDHLPDPHRRPDRPGWQAWLRLRLGEQATWRELGYAVVSAFALWWIDLGVIALSLGLPLSFVLQALVPPDPGGVWYWRVVSALVGALLLPVAAYPVAAWASARAEMTRAVLAPKETELGHRLVELTRSRARLVDAFDGERRRIERDLHDGAQQRLVALTVQLGLARLDVAEGSPEDHRLGEAQEQARLALAELRELVRGVHPQVLTDRGLPAAVADVAGRSPVPVDLDLALPGRLPPALESAAYFAVCEALTNVTKHAGAQRAAVRLRLDGSTLVVEVRDDGLGGADAAGPGLSGLADRVSVVDGRLYLSSPPGGPTVVRAEIPCAPTAASV